MSIVRRIRQRLADREIEAEAKQVIPIYVGRQHLGSVVVFGSGAAQVYEAFTLDRVKIGDFKTQFDAVRELLAAWLRVENARTAGKA